MKISRLSTFASAVAVAALLSGTAPALAATQATVSGSVTSHQGSTVMVSSGAGSQAVDTSGAAVSGGSITDGAKVQATGTMSGQVLKASQVKVLG